MLEHLGFSEHAAAIDEAIAATTTAGILTPDLGGSSTTQEVCEALVEAVQYSPRETAA